MSWCDEKTFQQRTCNKNGNEFFENSTKRWIYDDAYVDGDAKVSY